MNLIERLKGIDIGSRCKDMTYRISVRAFLMDYPDHEIAEIAARLNDQHKSDREFRLAMRGAVKAIEDRKLENPQPGSA